MLAHASHSLFFRHSASRDRRWVVEREETFSLDVAGRPDLRSTGEFSGSNLVITDSSGTRFTYEPQPSLDSADGQFFGYYSARADAYIRWPLSDRGAMQIGENRGGVMDWRPSQMQVTTIPVTAFRPPSGIGLGGNGPGTSGPGTGGPGTGGPGTGGPGTGGPGGIAIGNTRGPWSNAAGGAGQTPSRAPFAGGFPPRISVLEQQGQLTIAMIDPQGGLRVFTGRDKFWQSQDYRPTPALDLGAPLAMLPNARTAIPFIYTIDARGGLAESADGSRFFDIRWQSGIAPTFVPDTHLTSLPSDSRLIAIDDRGRCLVIDPAGRYLDVGPFNYRAVPGGVVQAVTDANGDINIFTIDRDGRLIQMRSTPGGRWIESLIETGHVPGGYLAAVSLRGAGVAPPAIYVSAVDQRSSLRVHREPFTRAISINSARLPPGSPLAITRTAAGELSVSAVTTAGLWNEWVYRNGWLSRPIRAGFAPGSHIVWGPGTPILFAIDHTGDLVAGLGVGDYWDCIVCGASGYGGVPVGYLPPRLVSSETIPNPPLPPVDVRLINTHREDLFVTINALGNPTLSKEIEIPVGGSVLHRFERDAGSTIVETYDVQAPDGSFVNEVFSQPIPPQSLYSLTVYENRIQSMVIDRTQKRLAAEQIEGVTKGLRSLGVFALPAGEGVGQLQSIDLYLQAVRQNNPGAASVFP